MRAVAVPSAELRLPETALRQFDEAAGCAIRVVRVAAVRFLFQTVTPAERAE